jgi:hypothetical protein
MFRAEFGFCHVRPLVSVAVLRGGTGIDKGGAMPWWARYVKRRAAC